MGVDANRFFGQKGIHSLFNSSVEAWLALKSRASERGIRIELLDVSIKPKNQEEEERLRAEWQKEAADRIIDWIQEHNLDMPVPNRDFGFQHGKIALTTDRLYGFHEYQARKLRSRIFDSPGTAWEFIKSRGVDRGVPVRIYEFYFKGKLDPIILELQRTELVQIIKDWIISNGRLPQYYDYKKYGGVIPVLETKLSGTGEYGVGKRNQDFALFATPALLWEAVKDALERDSRWEFNPSREVVTYELDLKFRQ